MRGKLTDDGKEKDRVQSPLTYGCHRNEDVEELRGTPLTQGMRIKEKEPMHFLIHFHRSIVSTSSTHDQFYTHLKDIMSRNKINQPHPSKQKAQFQIS